MPKIAAKQAKKQYATPNMRTIRPKRICLLPYFICSLALILRKCEKMVWKKKANGARCRGEHHPVTTSLNGRE
jgi:hypothetical protein